jgi:predicted enzyme related to lactoylglutathione lyase
MEVNLIQDRASGMRHVAGMSTVRPAWIEIGAPDAARTRDFFHRLFGWGFQAEGSGYATADPGVPTGLHGGDDARDMVIYFGVPDLDAAVARVRELGGTAPDPGPPDPRFGRFVECKDVDGVKFGLHQKS